MATLSRFEFHDTWLVLSQMIYSILLHQDWTICSRWILFRIYVYLVHFASKVWSQELLLIFFTARFMVFKKSFVVWKLVGVSRQILAPTLIPLSVTLKGNNLTGFSYYVVRNQIDTVICLYNSSSYIIHSSGRWNLLLVLLRAKWCRSHLVIRWSNWLGLYHSVLQTILPLLIAHGSRAWLLLLQDRVMG